MADKESFAKIISEVVINVNIHGHEHQGIVAGVIKDLCTDIITGRDVQKKHRRVVLNFNGPRKDLVIGAISNTEASSTPVSSTISTPGPMLVPPPPLFTDLSNNVKPITTKSRRQSPANL